MRTVIPWAAFALSFALALACLPAAAEAQTAFRAGERTTGLTKQCYYNHLGSIYTRTMTSVDICPLSIQVKSPPSSVSESSQGRVAPSSPSAGIAIKTGEQTTGMTKQCYYNHLGSTYTRTLSAVSICPLGIQIERRPSGQAGAAASTSPGTARQAAPTDPSTVIAIKIGEQTGGLGKECYYRFGSSRYVQIVNATQRCPLTVRVRP